jgi:hypothetical protein
MTWVRKWFDWLWVTAPRIDARQRIAARSARQVLSLAHARGCLRLGEYAVLLGSGEGGFSLEGLILFRWACLWALACEADGAATPEALLASAPRNASVMAAGGPGHRERLCDNLRRSPFDDVNLSVAQIDADRAAIHSLAHTLLEQLERPERELARAGRDAAIRVGAVMLGAAVLCLFGLHARLGPNLVQSWKTSSTKATCDPVHALCDGAVTTILFHTEEEESPWVELDLGVDRKPFSRIDVQNRIDCCQDRAVPLIAEVSDDETKWTEVAWRDEPFVNWTARFPPMRTRYVRLRVPRKTFLHLESIAVR